MRGGGSLNPAVLGEEFTLQLTIGATLTKPRLFRLTANRCTPGGYDDDYCGNPFSGKHGAVAKGERSRKAVPDLLLQLSPLQAH
jgi:hypothetical protein